MLKLILNSNPILRSLIHHCINYSGGFELRLASQMCRDKDFWFKWNMIDGYSRNEIKEFLKVLKSEGIEYKIHTQLDFLKSDREWVITINRII